MDSAETARNQSYPSIRLPQRYSIFVSCIKNPIKYFLV